MVLYRILKFIDKDNPKLAINMSKCDESHSDLNGYYATYTL
jgi:hypothetical protein